MTPQGDPPPKVAEQDFVITSNKQAGPLRITLSYLTLPAGRQDLASQRLVRVGPAEGFTPGAHYTIRYIRPNRNWAYPSSVDFIVDAITVDAQSLSYRIQLDGLPERRLLRRSDGRGQCGSNQPAIVQDFHFVLPSALQPYRQAVTYFSEKGVTGKFEPIRFIQSLCEPPTFGTTAFDEQRDLVEVDCKAPGVASILPGQVAFLELEDGLQTTEPVDIDLRKAQGNACHGMDMLTEALARGNVAKITGRL